jgi:hypothetical protein
LSAVAKAEQNERTPFAQQARLDNAGTPDIVLPETAALDLEKDMKMP